MEHRLLIYDQREIYYTKDDGTFCRCPICGINFRRDAIEIHLLIHTKSGFIHCRDCDTQYHFQDERTASMHFEYHISHLSYTCSLCGVFARFKEHIEDHLKSHHGITYYKCSFCNNNLHSYEEAKHHMYFQHPETRPNKTLRVTASSVPISYDQIVHNDLKTVLPNGRAIQDLAYSSNKTVIGVKSSVPVSHDQIVHNDLKKAFLPDRRAGQDLTCSPNETVIGAKSSVPILHDQIVRKDLNKTFLPRKYSVKVIQQEKRLIEKIPTKEPFSFESNAENSREKASHNEWLRPSSINGKCPTVQINLTPASDTDDPNQLSLVDSKLDVPQQSTNLCSNSNISCEVSSSGIQLDRHIPPITDLIQVDDELIHKTEAESSGIFKITDIKSEFCWEDVDDFEEIVTWSQQEENNALTEDKKDVLDLVEEITLRDQWQMNGNPASGEIPSAFSVYLQHYSVNRSKVLECPVCEKMYNPNVLKEHFYTHGVKRLVCTKCKKKCVNPSDLYCHHLSRHNSVKPFECSLCDRSFKMRCYILGHLRTDHGIRYTCPQCNLKFKYMKSHNVRQCISLKSKAVSSSIKETKERTFLRKTTKKASLNSRQLRSSKNRSLRTRPMASNGSHLDSHKEVTSEKTEMMEEVSSGDEDDDVTFSERGEMSKGRLMAVEVQPTRKQKDVANLVKAKTHLKKFRSLKNDNTVEGDESSVFSVFQLYSINSKKVLQCPLCEEGYNAVILRKHYSAHTDKDLVCRKCEMVFATHGNLYDHYFGYHSSVKPFECSLCDKSFKNQGGISQHLKVVHGIRHKHSKDHLKVELSKDVKRWKIPRRKGNDIAVPFKGHSLYSDFQQHYSVNIKYVLKCPVCQESYKPHVLRKHFNTHVIKDPACTKCKKVFQEKRSLYEHYLTTHCTEKPFKCSICDQFFKLKKDILLHLRTDHGIKYRCPQCNLKFKSLKDHNVIHCNIKSKLKSLVLKKVKKNKSVRKNMKQLRLSAST